MDCIYQGARSMYINPDECVDCGACKSICRMDAIYYEIDLPTDQHQHLADNAAFFSETLPGRDGPLGSPGGAANLGPWESTRRWSPHWHRAGDHAAWSSRPRPSSAIVFVDRIQLDNEDRGSMPGCTSVVGVGSVPRPLRD